MLSIFFFVINAWALIQGDMSFIDDNYIPKQTDHSSRGAPSNFAFRIRREKTKHNSTIKKRQAVIWELARHETHRFLIDFDLGNPPQHIIAEINQKAWGTYISESVEEFQIRPVPRFRKNIDVPGMFYPTRSSTYVAKSRPVHYNPKKFPDETGTWGADEIRISYHVFEDFNFIGVQTERSVLGIGPFTSEFLTTDIKREDKTNFFIQLKHRGFCQRAAYSIWIGRNSEDARGLIIFNAIDFRYSASTMYIFPLIDVPDSYGFHIKLDGITLYKANGQAKQLARMSLPIRIDISTGISRLPAEILETFYSDLGGSESDLVVSCTKIAESKIGIVFSGVEYLMPLKDVMVNFDEDEIEKCHPPFLPNKVPILGSNILSMFYMVFDLDNNEVGIAMARTSAELELDEHMVYPIVNAIPGRRAPLYSSTVYQNTWELVDDDHIDEYGNARLPTKSRIWVKFMSDYTTSVSTNHEHRQ